MTAIWLLLLAMAIVSCDPSNPVTPSASDTAAANLDLTISLSEIDKQPDPRSLVAVGFFLQNSPVKFANGETVTCNGVKLDYSLLGYTGYVPLQPVGGTYNVVYTRNGTATTVSLIAPARPQIISPSPGADITRSNNLSVTYVADSGTSVQVIATDSAGASYFDKSQPDSGTNAGFDVRSLPAGPGTLSLMRQFKTSPQNTGVRSAQTIYDVSTDITVTWK